jgi:hypothetical protein
VKIFEPLDLGQFSGALDEDVRNNYINEVDPSRLLRDPRFISDIKRYYAEVKGESLDDDEDAIRRWYSDRTWSNLNTVGAGRDWIEAEQHDNPDLKLLQARLQDAYERAPFFWQDGGMGDVDGWQVAKSISGALIADPINLVGGFLGKGAAGAAMAGKAVKGAAKTSDAIKAGAWSAAKGEAALNAGIELGHDALMQNRDIELGLQDEYSIGRGAMATGAGAVLGGAMGGVVGGVTGGVTGRESARALQAKQAQDIAALRQGLGDQPAGVSGIKGFPEGQSPDEFAQNFHRATDWQTPELTGDINVDGPALERARVATNEQIMAQREMSDMGLRPEPKPEELPNAFPDFDPRIARDNLVRATQAYQRATKDKADPEVLQELAADMRSAQMVDALGQKIEASRAEIDALMQTNDLKDNRTAAQRYEVLQRTVGLYRRLIEGDASDVETTVAEATRLLDDQRPDMPRLTDENTRRPVEKGDQVNVDPEGQATVQRAEQPAAPEQAAAQTPEGEATAPREVKPLEQINFREVLDVDGEVKEGFINAKKLYDNIEERFRQTYTLRKCLGV